MPFCNQCGTEVSEEANFCQKCGSATKHKESSGIANKATGNFVKTCSSIAKFALKLTDDEDEDDDEEEEEED